MNMVDIAMASKFAQISAAVDENGEVYIPPSLHVDGKIVITRNAREQLNMPVSGLYSVNSLTERIEEMKTVIGVIVVIAGVSLMIYLPLVVMLYGGIMQAVNSWGVDNSAVVWGIIRAVLCEVGLIPGVILTHIGADVIKA